MKLIIDISEEDYAETMYRKQHTPRDMDWADKIIVNGTPLDDLRAELHATAEMHSDGDYYLRDEWIDEYFDDIGKEESEETK